MGLGSINSQKTGTGAGYAMRLKDFFVVAVAFGCVSLGMWSISAGEDKTEPAAGDQSGVKIIKEQGPAGHSTIGIDESTVSHEGVKEHPLTFSELMNWDFSADNHAEPPGVVKELDGQKVRLVGFMYPLQEGKELQFFCLLRSTQTCCYGPRPQYNQYVFVEMEKPTEFHRLDPVSCVGKFHVEPNPDEGYIYRMEGQVCETASKEGS
jgi:hypothetical protein